MVWLKANWKAILGVLFTGLFTAAQVGPKDAVSNLAQWIQALGFKEVPDWLSSAYVDQWVKIVSSAVVLALILRWLFQKLTAKQHRDNPLRIVFSSSNFEEVDESSQLTSRGLGLGFDEGRRKTYWVDVLNSSPSNVVRVCVDIIQIAKVNPRTIEDKIDAALGRNRHRLKFKHGLPEEKTLSPGSMERVDVVSFNYAFLENRRLRIEGDNFNVYFKTNENFIEYKITVQVIASGLLPITRTFLVSVDPQNEFTMVPETWLPTDALKVA